MKIIILIVCSIIGAFSAPVSDDSQAVIESYENNIDEKGNYNFSFRTSNGIQRSENGEVRNVGQPDEHIVVTGEYSYIDPEGKLVQVSYYADEDGFHIIPSINIPVTPIAGSPISPGVVASLLGG